MILLKARRFWQTRRLYSVSVLVCLWAVSFAFGCKSGKSTEGAPVPQQAQPISSSPASNQGAEKGNLPTASQVTPTPIQKSNPNEYHNVNPERAGFKIVGELSSETVDSDGNVVDGRIQALKVDDQPSPRVKGNEYSIKLASDEMTDGKIHTADFGVIRVSSPENFAWSVKMTDTQIEKIQNFLKSKKK
jgi:hypothetical protein